MNRRQLTISIMAATAAGVASPVALARQAPPAMWDNLVQRPSKRLKLVYLLPGANFRAYTKVMFDPIEIAFEKDWQKDYNRTTVALSSRVTDADIRRVIEKGQKAAEEIFAKEFTKGGYTVVTTPAADVLRLRIAIINISVTAPDIQTPGRSRSFSREAGYATLVIEARDSVTGAILGRAVDARVAGDNYGTLRSNFDNRFDFRDLGERWASSSVKGLNELKLLAPS